MITDDKFLKLIIETFRSNSTDSRVQQPDADQTSSRPRSKGVSYVTICLESITIVNSEIARSSFKKIFCMLFGKEFDLSEIQCSQIERLSRFFC